MMLAGSVQSGELQARLASLILEGEQNDIDNCIAIQQPAPGNDINVCLNVCACTTKHNQHMHTQQFSGQMGSIAEYAYETEEKETKAQQNCQGSYTKSDCP